MDAELFQNKNVMIEFKNENMEHAKIIYSKQRKNERMPDSIDKCKLGGNAIKRLLEEKGY